MNLTDLVDEKLPSIEGSKQALWSFTLNDIYDLDFYLENKFISYCLQEARLFCRGEKTKCTDEVT